MNERLFELESKFSFQEDTINELNEVVIRHQQLIDHMRREMKELQAQLRLLQAQLDAGDSGEQRPPHY